MDIFNGAKAFAVKIPILLEQVGFYGRRKDIDISKGLFKGKREYDPLDIFIVQGLPQQTLSDCGIFIFKYSEYFAHGLIEDIPNPLDVKFVWNKVCVELFVHGMTKQVNGYISLSEHPRRAPVKDDGGAE
ncbi:uncharacterized protein LOC115712663 isoform X2 [Cannabis sativa]|uniref:uncharacterized protein LOC115712663 isoform X2 n=1 Tax=Cannabis sativa TaxID=3483 RepID=UPI0029CA9C6D|nr:uncharacterized protein LOC115712663 isoform X2 [Cannabis sativa]